MEKGKGKTITMLYFQTVKSLLQAYLLCPFHNTIYTTYPKIKSAITAN